MKSIQMETDSDNKAILFDKDGQQIDPEILENFVPPTLSEDDKITEDITVIFVLGGPGAGKGTQCQRIVETFQFVHLSAGDLLREEMGRPDSKYGKLISYYIKEGKIVPSEVTIMLLKMAMKKSGKNRFLIDGFPRALSQAEKFEQYVCEGRLVLFYDCNEEVLMKRLLKRGETSGRTDDNVESIRKRFKTFKETTYPVIEYFEKRNKVRKLDASRSVEEIFKETAKVIEDLDLPQKLNAI